LRDWIERARRRPIFRGFSRSPTLYGFTAATVLPGVGGPPTNSACVAGLGAIEWGQWCGNTTTPNPNFSHLRAADSQQTSFYSDDQHFSAAGQLLVANYDLNLLEQTLNPTPLPSAPPLFAGALGVIGLLARRRKQRGLVAG
jgi:hypothetical protein